MPTMTKSMLEVMIESAKEADSPHVDLSGVFGTAHPMYLSVEELHNVVTEHEPPAVKLSWDASKSVTVSNEDGGALATLQIKF